ncbi:hypothetical protein LINGRAHAP2_LOCUS23988 [Linum grandiflorum]
MEAWSLRIFLVLIWLCLANLDGNFSLIIQHWWRGLSKLNTFREETFYRPISAQTQVSRDVVSWKQDWWFSWDISGRWVTTRRLMLEMICG